MTCRIWHAFCSMNYGLKEPKMNAKYKQCYDTQA